MRASGGCLGCCWNAAGIPSPPAMSCYTHTHTHTYIQFTKMPLYAVFQCDQQGPRAEAGGRDPDVVTEAHRQHRGHLLRLLHYLWHLGGTGERGGAQTEIMRKQKDSSRP